VAGCCECGDEPSGSGATELVRYDVVIENKHMKDLKNGISQVKKYKLIIGRGIIC
jgi:hypothetical protein